MGARSALLGIGTLHELEILDPRTKRTRTLHLRGKWLAWDPRRRMFLVCTITGKGGSTPQALGAAVERGHKRFHQAKAARAVVVNVPDPQGALREMGLLKALVYRVPRTTASPGKNPYSWHHAFGDTGHKGGDHYPERVMPALLSDAKGNLFIKRRKGNIFRVDTWLRG